MDFENSKEQIISKIKERAKNLICPVCENKNMVLGGGFFAHDLQGSLSSRTIGGQNIPTIPVICPNCGFIREFSAGVLGFLPNKTEQENGNEDK